jgi:hypothetical protein
MARRRRSSSGTKRWLLYGILRFFGVSSPAVLIMALLSYLGFRTPVPDTSADSAEAQRAKKIVEAVASAKTKLKETLSSIGSKDGGAATNAATKIAVDDDPDLLSVTYRELFTDPPPAAESKRFPPPSAIPLDRPPAKVSDRDRKKASGDFPDLNPSPYR